MFYRILLSLAIAIIYSSSLVSQSSFEKRLDAFYTMIIKDGKVNYPTLQQDQSTLHELIEYIAEQKDQIEDQAYLINAYNLYVIYKIMQSYPISSVQKIPNFFSSENVIIGGEKLSLNQLEKEWINPSNDPRLHFALICGANGCPPFPPFSYKLKTLDKQLNHTTTSALHNKAFFQEEENELSLSQIFNWYHEDFKSNGGAQEFIEQYLYREFDTKPSLFYYPYDWSLNTINESTPQQIQSPSSNEFRYLASSLYQKGGFEFHLFNNYYTSHLNENGTNSNGWDFFSSNFQFLIGLSSNLNVGLDLKVRSVVRDVNSQNSVLRALSFKNGGAVFNTKGILESYSRTGITALGPKIKYRPFKQIGAISVQHTLYVPLGKELGGRAANNYEDYIDWDAPSLFTQIFYDQALSPKLNIFLETSLILENMDHSFWRTGGGFHQISTPLTVILNYYPTNKLSLYGLVGSAPQWAGSGNSSSEIKYAYVPYSQLGGGIKYLLHENLQFEVLVTKFFATQEFFNGSTYNLGIRYFKRD